MGRRKGEEHFSGLLMQKTIDSFPCKDQAIIKRVAMRSVKCAVIGAGWWGTAAHIPALKNHPLAELVAVQSQDAAKARKTALDFGATHACVTVEEVLAVDGLEAVIISSTPNAHYAQARAALERDLHVLIEKPMTIKVSEAEELVALAESKRRHFLMSSPWLYTARTREARRLIQAGALGRLKMISVLHSNFTVGLYRGLPWAEIFGRNPNRQNSANPYCTPHRQSYSDPAVAGGGQIYCQVSHIAALLGFLTERSPVSMFAHFDNDGARVDIYNTLNLKLEDGTLVSVASTGATPDSERSCEFRLYGTRGLLIMDFWKGTMEFHPSQGEVRRYPALAEADIYPMFAPAENLVDVILGRAENGSPASLGLYSMRIIEAACQSARTGENVRVISAERGL
jgi:predicted dehydrogenase